MSDLTIHDEVRHRRIDYWLWFYRLISWDSLLPVVIVCAPVLVKLVFPNRRGAVEIVAVLLPIAAFFIRYITGVRYIESNYCPRWLQQIQYAVFCIGIFVLVLFDSFVILFNAMAGADDNFVFAIFIAIYFSLMAFAMYPGRARYAS